MRAVECDEERIRRGSTGRVRLPGGLWIPFRIVFEIPLAAFGYVPVCQRALDRIEAILDDPDPQSGSL